MDRQIQILRVNVSSANINRNALTLKRRQTERDIMVHNECNRSAGLLIVVLLGVSVTRRRWRRRRREERFCLHTSNWNSNFALDFITIIIDLPTTQRRARAHNWRVVVWVIRVDAVKVFVLLMITQLWIWQNCSRLMLIKNTHRYARPCYVSSWRSRSRLDAGFRRCGAPCCDFTIYCWSE